MHQPSLDWLGYSLFSQGGGFYPVKNSDDTSTVLYVPVNQTGTYTLLTHSTLFGGNSTTESITLSAEFTNISPDVIIDSKNNSNHIIANSEKPNIILKSENDTSIISIPPSLINSDNKSELKTEIDLEFDMGLILGISIGVAIGLSFIFIIRQKNT